MLKQRQLHFLDVAEERNQKLPPIHGYEDKPLVSLEKAVEPLEKIVSDVQKMVAYAKEGSSGLLRDLSIDQVASIKLYSLEWEPREKSFFFILNQTLRSEDRDKLKSWFLYLKLILSALSNLPNFAGDVYRGVKLDLSSQYREGTIFTWWGFSSCTSSISVLEGQQFLGTKGERTCFVIKCKTGKDIRKLSFYQNEYEVLLPPATQLRVTKCRKTTDFVTIELDEVQPETAYEPKPFPSMPGAHGSGHANPTIEKSINQYESGKSIVLDNRCLVDMDIWIVVEQALNRKQCTELNLSKNRGITSDGISIIALALKTNRTLRRFYLTNNSKFSDECAESLADGLRKNQYLQVLDLSHNAIGDRGAEQLAEMLKANKMLRELDLTDNKICNQGIEYLTSALSQSNTTLERLSITYNPIADGCVNALIDMLKQNRTLKQLDVLETTQLTMNAKIRLTEVGRERLK